MVPSETGWTLCRRPAIDGPHHISRIRARADGDPGRAHGAGAPVRVPLAPYAVDPDVDYSAEPTTLVEFRLTAEGGGTRLTITESGFDRIPASRRDEAFRMNEGGWTEQIGNIERHVALA